MSKKQTGKIKNKFILCSFFFAFCFSLETLALTIEVNPRNLTVKELMSANELVKEAISLLPPLLKDKMKIRLILEFKDLGKEGKWGMAQHHLLGDNKIYLDVGLLPDIVAGEKNSRQNLKWATRLRTFRDIALGTVLHEVAHFFDEVDSSAISSKSEFLHLTYFNSDHEVSLNTLAAKSPNWYEFTSSAEAFAVNFEFFLLDPEFKCRKPLLYDFYATKVFKHTPFINSNCTMVNKFFEVNNILENGKSQYVDLDFSRLYQVHYLLADKGMDSSSKWGHAMLRLVFCAPERTTKGPECLNDLAYHKVLSFRAVPTSNSLSIIDGLTGKYPSYMFILPFTQVIVEYTVDELRPIKSVPLKLTNEQMKNLYLRALEIHWSYRGKYYFISNNCAVETLNLLKTTIPDFSAFEDLSAVTPQGVLDLLTDVGLADISSFYNLNTAWRNGLYYYPNDKVPSLAFAKLQVNSHELEQTDLKEFLFSSDAVTRSNVYHEVFADNSKSKTELNALYASAFYLEKQILKRQKTKLYTEAMLKLSEITDENSTVNKPSIWTEDWYYGYGIPTQKDFQDYYLNANEKKLEQQNDLLNQMKSKIEKLWDEKLKREYLLTYENLKYITTVYEKLTK